MIFVTVLVKDISKAIVIVKKGLRTLDYTITQ